MRYSIYALAASILVFLALLVPSNTVSYQQGANPSQNSSQAEIEASEAMPTLKPELVSICSCESRQGKYGTPTHYEADGVTVLRGRENPDDVGICQVNLYYHEAEAKSMGLDLFKEADNITFANWLYEREGSTPWNWSRSCWQ